MYNELPGQWEYLTGANATYTLPPNSVLLQIYAVATGGDSTLTIFGGASIVVKQNQPMTLRFMHSSARAGENVATPGTSTIVAGANMASIFIEYMRVSPT